MDSFNGTAQMTTGEFRTIQELVHRVIDARTYSADADENAAQRARAKGAFQAVSAIVNRILSDVNVYITDAYKGNANGIIDQDAWDSADFTGGQADQLEGGLEYTKLSRVDLASRVIYAPADASITLDLAVGSEY